MAAAIALGVAGTDTMALNLAYKIGGGVEYTDNVTRDPVDPQSSFVSILSAGVDFFDERPALRSRLVGKADYRIYENRIANNDVIGALSGLLEWRMTPYLQWTVEDTASDTVTDPLRPASTQNRQYTNIFSTGPDVLLRLRPRDRLLFGGRYARHTLSDTASNDNDRQIGHVRWFHDVSAVAAAGVQLETQNVTFDNATFGTDFRRKDAFVSFDRAQRQSRLSLEAGGFLLERDLLEDVSGGRGRVAAERNLSRTMRVSALASRNLSDAGQRLTEVGRDALTGLPPAFGGLDVVTTDVFVERYAVIELRRRRLRGYDRAGVSYTQRDFNVDIRNNRRTTGAIAEIQYDVGPRAGAHASLSYAETDLTTVQRVDRDATAQAGIVLHLTTALHLGAFGTHIQRRSSSSIVEFEENRATLSLVYQPPARRIGGLDVP